MKAIYAARTIQIPFNDWSTQRILSGMKRCTSRTKQYGKLGDIFTVKGNNGDELRFMITNIITFPLDFVARELFSMEGAESPDEFIDVWRGIYPHTGYVPSQRVYVHFFRQVV